MTTRKNPQGRAEAEAKKDWTPRRPTAPAQKTWTPSVFVPDALTTEMKATLKDMETDPVKIFDTMSKMSEEGYGFTFRYDDYHKCYAVWLSTRNEESVNWGLILTGRGSTFLKAAKQLLFLHFEVWNEEWASVLPEREIDD